MLRRFCVNYVQRHQNRWNQCLHIVGVPLTFVGTPVFAVADQPLAAVGSFVGGYLLQFLGHAIEGNDAGELILIKRWLGRPYVEFAPTIKPSKSND